MAMDTSMNIMSPPGLANTIKDDILIAFTEEEILQHFSLVAAHATRASCTGTKHPYNWNELQTIFAKLGCGVDIEEAWQALGLAMLDGPAPTAVLIACRHRIVQQLCGLVDESAWLQSDVRAARSFCRKIEKSALQCEESLGSALVHRHRLNIPKLSPQGIGASL